MLKIQTIMVAVLSLVLASTIRAETQTELSQYGITWKFDKPAEVGRYITGDWWVVGPVNVVEITPAQTEERNGSLVNPKAGKSQGYDKRNPGFSPTGRITLPLNLKPGDSLVSAASLDNVGDIPPEAVQKKAGRGALRTAAVLTCVDKAPPANAFRPAYVGTWKKQFTTEDLKLDRLPALAPVENMPKGEAMKRNIQRPWLDHQFEYVSREMHPAENMPDYGREITAITGETALALLIADFRKDNPDVLHHYVQLGIDYYGTTQSDPDLWTANGGHNSGRKLPIIFAGIVLDQAEMQNVKATFAEDQQTYYGKGYAGQKALFTITPNSANAKHEEVPPAEWETFGRGANNGQKAESYRQVNGPVWVAHGLTIRLLKAESAWNHPPFMDYVDRWVKETPAKISAFTAAMWNAYRKTAAPPA